MILIFLGWGRGRGRIVDVVNGVFFFIFFHEVWEWVVVKRMGWTLDQVKSVLASGGVWNE